MSSDTSERVLKINHDGCRVLAWLGCGSVRIYIRHIKSMGLGFSIRDIKPVLVEKRGEEIEMLKSPEQQRGISQ